MNILIVSRRYYPAMGGVETQIRLVVNELSRRQHHVEVATASPEIRFPGARIVIERIGLRKLLEGLRVWNLLRRLKHSFLLPRFENYMDGDVPVTVVSPTGFDRLRMLRILSDKICWEDYQRFYRSFYVPRLRALMRGKDVVHSVADGYLGWAAEEAARAESVPFLVTPYVHPGDTAEAADNIAFLKRADIVFALLETDQQRLIEFGVPAERLRLLGVVPLLPKSRDARGFRAAYGLGDKPVVLFVGRMIEYKGPLVLLNAAPYVWRELPDVHFLFAGPAGKQQMRWFTDKPDDRIRYLGQVSEQQKGDAMAACDLFCMPSTMEILPAVYLEAWSCGKAVVGGTAHGLRELIEGNGAGIVVQQNPKLLGNRLVELLRDEPRRREMSERGRALVERRFSEDSLVRAVEAAYGDLAGRSRQSSSKTGAAGKSKA